MNPTTETPLPLAAAPPVEPAALPPGKPARAKPALVTTRSVWLTAYALTAVAIVLRVLTLRHYVAGEIARQNVLADVHDPRLEKLAVNTGYLLAVLIALLLVWLLYSLASVMERNIFRAAHQIGRVQIGLYFVVAFLTTLPVHAVCAAFGIVSPKNSALYFLYVAVVGLASPLLFRRGWAGRSRGRVIGVFAFSVALAALSVAA
jgi:hypothetical protein